MWYNANIEDNRRYNNCRMALLVSREDDCSWTENRSYPTH